MFYLSRRASVRPFSFSSSSFLPPPFFLFHLFFPFLPPFLRYIVFAMLLGLLKGVFCLFLPIAENIDTCH